jgi:hypothetical protein
MTCPIDLKVFKMAESYCGPYDSGDNRPGRFMVRNSCGKFIIDLDCRYRHTDLREDCVDKQHYRYCQNAHGKDHAQEICDVVSN